MGAFGSAPARRRPLSTTPRSDSGSTSSARRDLSSRRTAPELTDGDPHPERTLPPRSHETPPSPLWECQRGTRRVEVFRQPRPPDVLKKERDEAQAEARQCQEDKARLLAEREGPGGLMGAAWMERAGSLASLPLGGELKRHPADALRWDKAWSYSYTRPGEAHPASVAVRLSLSNPGAEPWTQAGAALVDSAGEQVELARWPLAPIPANGAGAVVVGIEGERAQLGCPCTLKLWGAAGPRTVTLGNVTFPVCQQAGP
ncbi:DUF2381 family protein [Archangium minus]|uniref:DUF2381 family protein n=1 Tax=Archangium minus TaxID=83450 RepID=A0ABY9X956_9BACT|nr:DUF2381 family protein [Archangium minus]